MRILLVPLLALILASCTTIPQQLQGEFPDITPAQVGPESFGARVRWGGVILDVELVDGATCLEILSRNLDDYMRPEQDDYTGGRFIACKPGFQDPAVFADGREVTTIGRIRNLRVKQIDDFRYSYPVLDTETLVLWEKRQRVIVYRGYYGPYYYHYPWGYPYWGWGHYRPFPYRGPIRVEERSTTPEPSIIDSGAAPAKSGDGG